MHELSFATASELAAGIRRGRFTSLELVEHYLGRVDEVDRSINAVVTVDAERARREAARADEMLARGDAAGPLHGVPMTIKDSIETQGMRTTSGAAELEHHVPEHDALAVGRLKSAGAIVFGKTNLPQYAGDFETHNDVFGTTNNPWALDRSAGGSSGGAAAAVAAGLTALELGSDIAGSIRNPAHFCGVFGHKPSYGIVPTVGHIPGPPGSMVELDLGVIGPLARSADDLELALNVVAGASPREARGWTLTLPAPRHQTTSDYRIASWLEDPACPVDGEVAEVLHDAVQALRHRGLAVEEGARPAVTLGDSHRTFLALQRSQLSMSYSDERFARLQAAANRGGDRPLTDFARSVTMTHRDWMKANEARARLRARWADFFAAHDALLCPVAPVTAPPHAHEDPRHLDVDGRPRPYWDLMVWPGLASVAHLPATVVPVGLGRAGLPVGIQVVGPYLEDRTTIDVARRIAEVLGGFQAPPQIG
jgi:amidase